MRAIGRPDRVRGRPPRLRLTICADTTLRQFNCAIRSLSADQPHRSPGDEQAIGSWQKRSPILRLLVIAAIIFIGAIIILVAASIYAKQLLGLDNVMSVGCV